MTSAPPLSSVSLSSLAGYSPPLTDIDLLLSSGGGDGGDSPGSLQPDLSDINLLALSNATPPLSDIDLLLNSGGGDGGDSPGSLQPDLSDISLLALSNATPPLSDIDLLLSSGGGDGGDSPGSLQPDLSDINLLALSNATPPLSDIDLLLGSGDGGDSPGAPQPDLSDINLLALSNATPPLSDIDLLQLGVGGGDTGSAPPLDGIDLSSVWIAAPDLASIDLLALSPGPSTGVTGSGSATLRVLASGQGGGRAMGAGSVLIGFGAEGEGSRPPAGSSVVGFSVSSYGLHGSGGAGSSVAGVEAFGTGYLDWLSVLPPISLQEVYRLVITGEADGLPDLHIGGISSWQATNQSGGRSSYLQAVIPAADSIIDDIADRKNGFLVIQKGYRTSDGSARYEEILRSRFDNLRPDRGQRALTVTVSGYMPGRPLFSGSRTLTGIRSISTQNGKRRVRCDVDLFLQPGMNVEALGDSFVASFINYYVSSADKFCEVGER